MVNPVKSIFRWATEPENAILIMSTVILLTMGYMHELVHVEIFKSYGIASKVDLINHLPNFVTIPESPCPNDMCEMAHNMNEAITYTFQLVFILIALGLYFILGMMKNILIYLKANNEILHAIKEQDKKEQNGGSRNMPPLWTRNNRTF